MADINSMGYAKAPKTMLLNGELTNRGFRVGVFIYDLIRLSQKVMKKNYTWSGDKAIAEQLSISPSTVQRAVKELASMGYIKKAYIPFKDQKYRIIYMGEAPDEFVKVRMKEQALKDLKKKSQSVQDKILKGEYTEAKTIDEKAELVSYAKQEQYKTMKAIHLKGRKR